MDIVSTIRTKKIIRFESRSRVVADDRIILMFNGFNDQLNDLITFGQTWLCVFVLLCSPRFWMSTDCSPQKSLCVRTHRCACACLCAESPSPYVCVYVASVHCWLSSAVCVGAQVQLLLSPVAVISELRGIISSLQLS